MELAYCKAVPRGRFLNGTIIPMWLGNALPIMPAALLMATRVISQFLAVELPGP
jgi:hypothetical protein